LWWELRCSGFCMRRSASDTCTLSSSEDQHIVHTGKNLHFTFCCITRFIQLSYTTPLHYDNITSDYISDI
jgi:hypothetical protein